MVRKIKYICTMLPIYFAPLQGYTEDIYRRLHNEIFGGIDRYYTPFLRLEHGKTRQKDMRDIRPDFNRGVNVVPQIIASSADELRTLFDVVCENGYREADINMGCPFPLQTRHGRGAGLLQRPEQVAEICRFIASHPDTTFSVKMRLGLEQADEWQQILPMLNDTPLRHITLHPRTATQQYKGELHMEQFEAFMAEARHPVVFNGDVTTTEQIERLEQTYPQLSAVMIGRGLLARPSLAAEYARQSPMSDAELLRLIRRMHSEMRNHYEQIIPGESQCLNKLRTFWEYMEPTLGRKQWKKIMKAGNMKNYLAAIG